MSAQELVQIRPLELEFPFELNKEIKCSCHVENKSDGYVAFKVQSTDPKKYRVKPNHGLMEPGSDFSIVVTLNPQTDAPPNMNCKDKFQVKTVIATESTILNSIKDVTNIMKGPGKLVHEVLLPVTYFQNQLDREGSDANIVPLAFMRGGQQKPETIEEGEEGEEEEEEEEEEEKENGVFLASDQNARKLEELFRKEVQARKKIEEQLAKVMKESEGYKKKVMELQQKMPCVEFKFEDLKKVTDNFDEAHEIGKGGFGVVYKGVLHHTDVAIKKIKFDDVRGFNVEIETLSKVRHPNLVTLIGACMDNDCLALVYEYLPRGSLEDHLRGKNNTPPLSGETRIRIALEICSALCFLHSTQRSHGDLKPDNILLDSNYGSKLSDFGTCRKLIVTTYSTTPGLATDNVTGTFAYMDPEYLSSRVMTQRFDVYSFGVVLLRLATGKDVSVIIDKAVMGIISAVDIAIEDKTFDKLADASIEWPSKEMPEKLAKLGLRCFEKKKYRPTMAEVFESLKDIAAHR